MIYLWGVPVLLMGDGKASPKQALKNLLNPMFICLILGMVVGLTRLSIPRFLQSAISTAGSCMSPLAMLLTGMTIAHYRLKDILSIKSVYFATILRLLVIPLLFLGASRILPMRDTFATCGMVALAMPLGLNTIVIPNAMGKDTRLGAGMALVSHIISCITIPVMFALLALSQ
jgi:predicted permease